MLVVWGAGLAVAADLEVGLGATYPTIADALDVAASGDTIVLRSGVYTGAYDLDAAPFTLTFQPAPGALVTLESTSDDGFFYVRGATVTVRDLAIDAAGRRAARITSGSLTLERVDVEDGRGAPGAGVLIGALGRLTTVGGSFTDNDSSAEGGAIRVDAGGELSVVGTRFAGNAADRVGGAIDCRGTCSVADARFVGNTSHMQGGAVFVDATTTLSLDRTWFCANHADQQGGALAVQDVVAGTELGHLVFFGNTAGQQGGGVWSDAPFVVYNTDFLGNTSAQQGAAVYSNAGVTTFNLILTQHAVGADVLSGSGLVATDNTAYGNAIPLVGNNASAPQTQTLTALDPLYVAVDPLDCEASDLHLATGSPALGAGAPAYGVDHGALGEVCTPLPEVAGDGIDQDCNGVDLCHVDGDLDGAGGPTTADGVGLVCTAPYHPTADDCDDADPGRFPGNEEEPADGVDQDCDEAELCYVDEDEDGFGVGEPEVPSADLTCEQAGVAAFAGDCDDTEASVSPVAPDQCDNGVDDDCDGEIDNDVVLVTWYRDLDGDGHGALAETAEGCQAPPGYVAIGDDCDDADGTVYPDAAERCDGVDQDCDGAIDEGLPEETSHPDADGDGYGDPDGAIDGCRPEGNIADGSDCDDGDGRVFPGALELCNGVDDDCDGALSACDLEDRGATIEDGGGEGPIAGCGCRGAPGPLGAGGAAAWIAALGLVGVRVRRVRSAPGRA